MTDKNNTFIKKAILFFLLELIFVTFLWSEDKIDNDTLKTILEKSSTTVEMYIIPFSYWTFSALKENDVRRIYDTKMILKPPFYPPLMNLIFAVNNLPKHQYVNVRIVIDIIVNKEVIYTVSISAAGGIEQELQEALNSLIGF
jgi:hypothetical protein